MAYMNAHVKVTIFGDMFTGGEIWSTGFHIGEADEGGGNFGVSPEWVEALKAPWQGFFSGATEGFSGNFRTLGIKAGVLLPDGKYDLSTIYTASYNQPISGGSMNPSFPPQVALVAQLRAASPVGLGAKGRMYLPGITHPVNGQGRISSAAANTTATGLKNFLDAAEAAVNSPGYVINASKGRVGVPFAPPVHRRVTSVLVGDVYDTQRRRRNALRESYSTQAMNATP
jgi:hypothetical protein